MGRRNDGRSRGKVRLHFPSPHHVDEALAQQDRTHPVLRLRHPYLTVRTAAAVEGRGPQYPHHRGHPAPGVPDSPATGTPGDTRGPHPSGPARPRAHCPAAGALAGCAAGTLSPLGPYPEEEAPGPGPAPSPRSRGHRAGESCGFPGPRAAAAGPGRGGRWAKGPGPGDVGTQEGEPASHTMGLGPRGSSTLLLHPSPHCREPPAGPMPRGGPPGIGRSRASAAGPLSVIGTAARAAPSAPKDRP